MVQLILKSQVSCSLWGLVSTSVELRTECELWDLLPFSLCIERKMSLVILAG